MPITSGAVLASTNKGRVNMEWLILIGLFALADLLHSKSEHTEEKNVEHLEGNRIRGVDRVGDGGGSNANLPDSESRLSGDVIPAPTVVEKQPESAPV